MTHALAVLTPEVGVASETFVDWDCNQLLPGRTAVITDPPPRGETVLRGPTWAVDGPTLSFSPVPSDPPPGAHRRRELARFVIDAGVEAVLVQYLDLALRWCDTLRELPVPVWVRGHGADLSARWQPGYARLAELAGIIVPTHAAAARLVPDLLPPQQVHVIRNHVDVAATPGPVRQPDAVRCLTVGRLVEKKGHANLLRAFATARQHHPLMTLDIIGDGPLRHRLTDLVCELDLLDSVRLLGARPPDEVLTRTTRADIYLQPSVIASNGDREGQPLALLQAMATGRPCVVTHHEGVAETLVDGESAALVAEHDVNHLATTLIELAGCADTRSRMGRAAWTVAALHHSHEVVRPRLLHLLGLEAHA